MISYYLNIVNRVLRACTFMNAIYLKDTNACPFHWHNLTTTNIFVQHGNRSGNCMLYPIVNYLAGSTLHQWVFFFFFFGVGGVGGRDENTMYVNENDIVLMLPCNTWHGRSTWRFSGARGTSSVSNPEVAVLLLWHIVCLYMLHWKFFW